jgi:hypothetical protein
VKAYIEAVQVYLQEVQVGLFNEMFEFRAMGCSLINKKRAVDTCLFGAYSPGPKDLAKRRLNLRFFKC